jgi:hypothetical protein
MELNKTNDNAEKNRIRREKYRNNPVAQEKHKAASKVRYQKNKQRYYELQKKWVDKNKEKVTAYKKQWNTENKPRLLEKAREYRIENREAINAWRRDNKDKCNVSALAYQKRRRLEDPIFKLSGNIRTLIGGAFRRGSYGKKSKTQEILGCDFNFLETHLIGSAIKNYGVWLSCERYEIDHIVPLASAKTEEDIIKLNHYSNLQYLTSLDNNKKYNKMDFVLGGRK